MNPEISRHKFDNFVKRVEVCEIMDKLTDVLSDIYEHDQNHTD